MHRIWAPGPCFLNFDAAIMENMDYRGGPPPIMRNALRNDRGAGSLEYLGIIIVALVTVGAIIAAVGKFDLGEKIACQVQQLGTAQASCAGGGSSDAPTQADRRSEERRVGKERSRQGGRQEVVERER